MIKNGDGVLLQRGSTFRRDSTINITKGITIGAYGTGDKPVIYGSTKNYAIDTEWVSNGNNVYALSTTRPDIGIIVFNHGEKIGYKKLNGISELTKNGDFYHDLDNKIVYIYMDKGSPDKVYESIEIGSFGNLFMINNNVSNLTIDNLCIKYVGSHAIGTMGKNSNIVITNNEIGWIGGSLQEPGTESLIRYGNGIQLWEDHNDETTNCTVDNNWVYQCYDTGITFQGRGGIFTNLTFKNNLMEYNSMNFEFFDGDNGGPEDSERTNDAVMKNIKIQNNIMRFAGCGWGQQRPDPEMVSHIRSGTSDYNDENIADFYITDNIFDCSARNIVHCYGGGEVKGYTGLYIEGNAFYQVINGYGTHWMANGFKSASNEEQLITAISFFDTQPKLIKVLE